MITSSPPFGPHIAAPVRPPSSSDVAVGSLRALSLNWAAIHQAGAVVAALAGLPDETPLSGMQTFPALIHAAGGWRRTLAEQGVNDLAAVMEPGLAALLAIHACGAEPTIAAQALWDEFHAARTALLVLLPPPEALPEPAPT